MTATDGSNPDARTTTHKIPKTTTDDGSNSGARTKGAIHTHNYSNSTKVMKTRRIEAVLLRVCESLKCAASRAGVGHWRLVEMSEKKRPTVVKILVLIVVIGSIIPVLAGVMMLTGGSAYEGYFMQELLSQIVPTYSVLIGVVALVAAWGLWLGRGWAWILALIIFIIGIIMDLVTLPTGIVGVVIDAIVLYLLMRPDTRKFCGK